MRERYLRRHQIAEKMACGERKAIAELKARGVYPIDLGRGKGRGLRWLESAVDAAMLAMHQEAQPKLPARVKAGPVPGMPKRHLKDMRVPELQELLTSGKIVQ